MILSYRKRPDSLYELLDVHGAGAQRSDPKAGNPDDYPYGRGPQGDVVRINNYVRCVRSGATFEKVKSDSINSITVESSSDVGTQSMQQENSPPQ